jgi:serine/threonine protein phosphatase PrpC
MDEQESAIATSTAVCAACGLPVMPDDAFCEACGHRLVEPVPASQPLAPQSGGPLPQCSGCNGTSIDPDGYCEQCGMRQPSGRDHVETELFPGGVAGVSDKGLRHSKNEDSMAIAMIPGLPNAVAAVVSDGVSSSPRPEDASRAAAEIGVATLVKELAAGAHPQHASRTALEQAAQAVAALADSQTNAPACTYVSALVSGGKITIAWVGDSRAYWVNATAEGGARLTEDDSWAEQMVALGAMSAAEAYAHRNAHVLVGWLGADSGAGEPHVKEYAPTAPGYVVVCSDGLWNYVPEPGDLAAATPRGVPPLAASQRLVQVALAGGGHDNVTVVVIPFNPEEA